MSDLVAWLRAQLDLDERDIEESRALNAVDLHWSMPDWLHRDRMLAEVQAKRRILDLWADADDSRWDLPDGINDGRDPDERLADESTALMLDMVVAVLALPYADRPGYRQEWKP